MQTPHELETQIKNTIKQLAELTDKTKASAFFKNYLTIMSRFHKYSMHNQMLILIHALSMKINPTKLMGFQQWNSFERKVKRGQKGIAILIPIISKYDKFLHRLKRNPDTRLYFCDTCKKYYGDNFTTELASGFKAGYVFDISQTEGKPLPEIEITVDGENSIHILNALEKFCEKNRIILQYKQLGIANLYGYTSGDKIVISETDTTDTKTATLIHEIAHNLLHKENHEMPKQQREIQAEAVSFAVCNYFGIESKGFNYLALYDADYKKIMENLEVVSGTSKMLINNIKKGLIKETEIGKEEQEMAVEV